MRGNMFNVKAYITILIEIDTLLSVIKLSIYSTVCSSFQVQYRNVKCIHGFADTNK